MKKVKIWDGAIRLFHWGLAAAFGISVYSAFQDKFGIYADLHLYAGVTILALVAWRILWGFIGSETARFETFVKKPRSVLLYVRHKRKPGEPYAWLGHNPAGGWSVVAMLALLFLQALLGLFSSDDMIFSGPFAEAAGDASGVITELHETIGYALIGLVSIHILAVFGYATRRVNLLMPIIFGTRRVEDGVTGPKMAPTLKGLALMAVFGGLAWLLLL
ncbi:MAG: hypothetical protein EP335_07670 [Alphaproteobacteria bacterium]|nr:MAG: hypothetical protein EP335_07670 [Alphaproteobacteria bacterium]